MAMQIGDLIRMKREEHGLTQEQLAELIGRHSDVTHYQLAQQQGETLLAESD